MKPMRLTSVVLMLLVAFGVAAQEEFFDDVYFSSKSKKKSEQVEEKKVVQPKKESVATSARTVTAGSEAASSDDWDVDAYNRRYSSVEVEEPYSGDEYVEEDGDVEELSSERRSDTEYTERIIRYHSPSKITIAGADQVDLYVSDGYYAYGYDTDYSDGSVDVNINIGNAWWSPWYANYWWYDPWFYGYSPWWTYSARFYSPYWSFGWGWGGFYAGWYGGWYDPWYSP